MTNKSENSAEVHDNLLLNFGSHFEFPTVSRADLGTNCLVMSFDLRTSGDKLFIGRVGVEQNIVICQWRADQLFPKAGTNN